VRGALLDTLIVGAVVSALASAFGCGTPPPPPSVPAPVAGSGFMSDAKPLRFHSARFELSIPFPDGRGWKIDDHKSPLLVATHAATDATFTLGVSSEPELMNRQRCEAAARARDLVHDTEFQTVADEVIVGPGPYDTRVTVAALPSTAPHRVVSGHVFLFGAYMRKCLFAHYETRQHEGEDEAAVSERLAVARLQMLGAIRVEAFDAPDLSRKR
jgi:hypothetical protein